jgi:hypothetical protein
MSVLYVAPDPPKTRLPPLWASPQDFIYAVLQGWSLEQLCALLEIMHRCFTLLPFTELCNTEYLREHYIPICLPCVTLHPAETAFLALKAAAEFHHNNGNDETEETIKASIRVVFMLFFTVDYRFRIFVMTHYDDTLGRMGVRVPSRRRVWNFFELGGGARLREHVETIEQMIHHSNNNEEEDTMCQRRTRELAHYLQVLYVTQLCPNNAIVKL